ncbi:hypothetical protein F01_480067 [Burkholderia cenocepacia]|nr:hypothetical protein F01_480067 [Burkholderia cenocepacia]
MTKLFRQFDSVPPRHDGELIRRDMPGRAETLHGCHDRLPRSASNGHPAPLAGNLELPLHFGPSLGEALISGGWRATSNRL